MRELIKVVEEGLGNYSSGAEGGVVQPVRTVFRVANNGKDEG